jgi:hypothetical protein
MRNGMLVVRGLDMIKVLCLILGINNGGKKIIKSEQNLSFKQKYQFCIKKS